MMGMMKKRNDIQMEIDICEYRIKNSDNQADIEFFKKKQDWLILERARSNCLELVLRNNHVFLAEGMSDSDSQISNYYREQGNYMFFSMLDSFEAESEIGSVFDSEFEYEAK